MTTSVPRADKTSEAVQSAWSKGLASEIGFWDKWTQSGGFRWPEDFQNRLNPQQPLQEHVRALMNAKPGDTVRILDVGAGPLTILGKVWEGRRVEMQAVDSLADEFDKILARNGVVPPVRTIKGDAERLTDVFPPDTFDFVYARNCLDHSYDPMQAIRQIVLVLKPGAAAMLEHAPNEAVTQRYVGLHQWNFCIEDGKFLIWRPDVRIDVQEALGNLASVEARPVPNWVRVSIRKSAG